MTPDDKKLVSDFIRTFEEVFDRDWPYTKVKLGIAEESDQQRAEAKQFGLETIPSIESNGTFLKPLGADETEDWGHRGMLLKLYRELKSRSF